MCPHPAIGPAIVGSPTVNVNKRPALRVDDTGIHAACCGLNTWTAQKGAPTVFINGKAAFRMNDVGRACGGVTKLIEGSSNVIIGDDAGSGGASGRPAGPGGASQGQGQGGGATAGATTGATAGSGSGSDAHGSTAGGGATGAATAADGSAPPPGPGAPEDQKPDETPDEKQIEVQLVNVRGEPQRNVRFDVTLPDGTVRSGTSGADGYIRISGIAQSGQANLVLPEIDASTGP
jgi:hypothetical protein